MATYVRDSLDTEKQRLWARMEKIGTVLVLIYSSLIRKRMEMKGKVSSEPEKSDWLTGPLYSCFLSKHSPIRTFIDIHRGHG